MEEWKTVRFGDLYAIDSRNGLSKPSSVRGTGYKMINMGELFANDFIRDIPMELVPLSDREKETSRVLPNDLLFARQSLTLEGAGKCCIVIETSDLTVFESHLIRVRLKDDVASPLFYYYYFRSPQSPVKRIVTQAVQAGIKASDLAELEVSLPPLPLQRRISSLLSSLDAKIETNRRINARLEEMAQTLFRSWFIDFTPFKQQEFVRVGEYISPKRGRNLLTKDAMGGEVPVVAGGLNPSAYHNEANTKAPVITISASGANAGFVRLWTIPVWSADSSFIDTTITDNVYFWYNFLKYNQKAIYDSQTGSAQPHIYPQHIENLLINELEKECVEKFNKLVEPFYAAIGNNEQEISRLSSLRDTLLPKLMSGDLIPEEITA